MKVLLGLFIGVFLFPAVCAAAEKGSTTLGDTQTAQEADPQPPPLKIFKYTNRSGVPSFSDRAPTGIQYEILLQYRCFACNLKSAVNWDNIPLQLEAFKFAINSAARKYRVDPALVRAVIHAESAFKPGAMSNKGAAGLMQLMPGTAKDMGVANVMSPEENIQGGVRYLAWLLEQNRGNTTLATAAYNAGPGAVKLYNGIPPFEETQTYVKRVKTLHDRYKLALVTSSNIGQASQAVTY